MRSPLATPPSSRNSRTKRSTRISRPTSPRGASPATSVRAVIPAGTDTMLARVDPHEFIMNAQAIRPVQEPAHRNESGPRPGFRARRQPYQRRRHPRQCPRWGHESGHHQRDRCRPPAGYPAGDHPTREITCSFRVCPSLMRHPRRWCAPGVWSTAPGPSASSTTSCSGEARSWSPGPWPSTPSTTLPRTRSWMDSSTTDCGVTPTTSDSSTLRPSLPSMPPT